MARRGEVVFGFRGVVRDRTPAPPDYRFYPAWMTDAALPVPVLPIWAQQQHQKVFDVQILALIDGRRSIDDIVAALCREYGLPADRCRAVVDRFFASVYEKEDAGR
jgi:hypothetical protein